MSTEDRQLFLSNLATDVSEKDNLAKQHPDVVQGLRKLHDDWLAANKALLPAEASVQDKKGNEQ